ncbi:AMP-binding protein [Acinetobacter lwoffii]|uniref:AMP-binding protein n=1 Tax=Acinetobacter lwoffii TaxID=28090 RepID=UPI00209B4B0D|nr:AMP-binding protein [Acinetobacter lwoffii]MCO8073796.1 AMP-binding protein [Acinetobacter lwoffii]MCO8076773.1 AMP-binding protein [Acinetobacter lwoffii]
MSSQPWMEEYKKWNINPEFTRPDPEKTLSTIIAENLVKFQDKTAFIYLDRKFSYHDIDVYSQKLASYLQSLGLTAGSRIAVMLPNIIQYPIATFAIIRAGYVLVNVNPMYTQRELYHQLQDSGAEALIILGQTLEQLTALEECPQLKYVISTHSPDFIQEQQSAIYSQTTQYPHKQFFDFRQAINQVEIIDFKTPVQHQEDTVILQYTGGTTGVSKGAELSHRNILFNIAQNSTVFISHFGDRYATENEYVFCALPLYHIYGFTICLFSYGLSRGFANVLIPNPRDLDALADQYQKHPPTVFPGVNTMFNALAHHSRFRELDHSRLKTTTGGGASILKNTAELWHEVTGCQIYEGYGLSETSPTATFNPPLSRRFSGTIGFPLAGTEILILNDEGKPVELNQAGEIAIRGPQVMKGYWQQPEATAQVFTKDGFFLTGDIGCMDEQGYITILDRKKDMILVSGFNVYPNELEGVLSKHPKILECAVIGIDDEKSGQVPKAFIVKQDETLTQDEVMTYLKQQLTSYKLPKYIEFVAGLPKSAVGKILRRELPRTVQPSAKAC